ncbi:Myb-like DNA-binding domain protein [Mortierella sp. AD031]|nr:Myb-like DNA-binding domain protein [Mortierella sp. AD031]
MSRLRDIYFNARQDRHGSVDHSSLAHPQTVRDEPESPQEQPTSVRKQLATRRPRSNGLPWTHQEDEILFDLRQQRVKWRTIGAKLQRTVASCYSRYYRFLDPFLADAIENEQEDEEDEDEVESGKADLKTRLLSGTLEKPSVRPSPYVERGPWKAKDRERLELLVKAKVPWTIISLELQRNQDSCKEKWLRIQKSRLDKRQYSKKVRGEQWTRLYKEGFTAHHRNQLVRAVEKHLAAKRSSTIYDDNPLGLLGVEDPQDEEGPFDLMMERQSPVFSNQQTLNDINRSATDLSVETIDWDAISRALKNKFPASRLRSMYHELAASKLVWTPEEDERLFRAMIRLGPPELQPKIWTMIKDAFGDEIRTSDDYRARWRELDMPQLEREWDLSEKKRFWRRWMEYQEGGSFLQQQAPSSDSNDSLIQSALEPRPLLLKPSQEPTWTQSSMDAWDMIAEGLEYRHGRDCQLYFARTTHMFPKDPELFRYLTYELAKAYVEPRAVSWSPDASRLLVATVNSFLQANKLVRWEAVARAMDHQYTAEQCESKWLYWSQNHVTTPDAFSVDGGKEDFLEQSGDSEQSPKLDHIAESRGNDVGKGDAGRRLWTDEEVKLLKKGVEEYGLQWSKIRDAYLPHRAIQMIHERYWRMQAKKRGRFSEKERSLLETAMEIFGEDADWELIAGQVPGRTANQCRKNWKYSKTHHVLKLDEPWTDQERERLKTAVARFGKKKWVLVSEFVVGKTPDQCRNEWREKLDPAVNKSRWSGQERDRLMELVMSHLSRQEDEERARKASGTAGADGQGQGAFIDLAPRYNGKRKIDWNEIAKEFKGRTSQQCRLQFDVHRALYRLQGDF